MMRHRMLWLVTFAMAAFGARTASATIYANGGHIEFKPDPHFTADANFIQGYVGTIWQDAERTDPTSVWFRVDLNRMLLPYTGNTDEGSDWYIGPTDALYPLPFWQDLKYHPLPEPFADFQRVIPGLRPHEFYLFAETSRFSSPDVVSAAAWIKLRTERDGNFWTIRPVESAAAYGDSAATFSIGQVPEPTVIGSVAACALLTRRLRRLA